MEKEYIKINKPSRMSTCTNVLRKKDDKFWKEHVFFHLLSFYKNYDKTKLSERIATEKAKKQARIEDEIAKYIRNYLHSDESFNYNGFRIKGGVLNDETKSGIYDISIFHSYWVQNNNVEFSFHFECKNLEDKQDLINKYVYYNIGNSVFDGGVYRYFNGKYAQNQNFGGMLGFILSGNCPEIKDKIHNKLNEKFNVSPEGDLEQFVDKSINENDFTFDSYHKRKESIFVLHHLLFTFSN